MGTTSPYKSSALSEVPGSRATKARQALTSWVGKVIQLREDNVTLALDSSPGKWEECQFQPKIFLGLKERIPVNLASGNPGPVWGSSLAQRQMLV